MLEVFKAILDHRARGERCVLVSAVGAQGSAPRKAQSHMLVDRLGRVCGTVGGGAVEGNSIAHAMKLLTQGTSDLKTFELYEQASQDIGMICGGVVRVHFQWIAPDDVLFYNVASSAVSALESGRNAWLMINLDAHRFSLYDGESLIGESAPQDLVKRLNASSLTCMIDDVEYYMEQLSYGDRVYVFGGGHVAQALVPMLAMVGFHCIVIEDREEFCRKELFPQAHRVVLLHEHEWKDALCIGGDDCICIMTRGHKNDLACQAFALQTQACYIGVIGSRRKVAAVNAQLGAMGFDAEQVARIVTPIGLEIGAVTPAEIAVSITAQMIAHRASRRKEGVKKSCMA